MRDPLINDVLAVLREHQAELRAQGQVFDAAAGDHYIKAIETRFPCRVRQAPPLVDRRKR